MSSLPNSPAEAVVAPGPGGDSKGQAQSSDELTSKQNNISSGVDGNGPPLKTNQNSPPYGPKMVPVSEGDASGEDASVAAPSEDVRAMTTLISDRVAEADAAKATTTTTSGSSPDVKITEADADADASSKIAAVAASSEDVKTKIAVTSVGVAEADTAEATATATSGSSPDVKMAEAEAEADASSKIAAVAAPSEDVRTKTSVPSVGVAEADAAEATATAKPGSSPDVTMGTGTETKQTPTTEAPSPSQTPSALLHSNHKVATRMVSSPVEEGAGISSSSSATDCNPSSQKCDARTPSPSTQDTLYAAEAEYQAAPDTELLARQANEKGSAKKSRHQSTNKTEKAKKAVTPGQVLYRASDDDWLSPQLCLVRSQMEAFAAQVQDVKERRSAGGSIVPPEVGQVGLRCRHCVHVPLKLRTKGSVLYPKSVRAIHMAMRNFQRHHLMSCRYMPDSVKTKYSAIKNKAVQSKKDSYIYLAQSCKEMGIIEEGGYLKKGSPEERTASPVQGVESINRPTAAASAPSLAAARSGSRSPVNNNPAASSISLPQSPQQQAESRQRSNDNVKAASGLLSLFKKSSPATTATQQQLRAVAGISDQQPTATSFASAVANMGGSPITSGIQANFSMGWQQAQLQKQIAYYNAVGSAAAAGTASLSALANGGANVSMAPSAAAAGTYPRALASFSSPGEIAAPDIAAAYYNASEAALTPADIAARAAASEATARSSQQAPAPLLDQVQHQAQQMQQQAQAQQDRYVAALSAQQRAQAQVQAQSSALLNGTLYDGAGSGLLDASQLAGLGAQLDVGPSGAALSGVGVSGSADLSTLLDTTHSSDTAGAAADASNGSNSTQKMKLLARADYLRYLSTLNRMSATIALAQRQASLLQSYPTNHALQADYQATLATMNEEMASAKILALGLREWQLAIDSDSLSQQFQAKRAQEVAQMELALRRMA